MRGRHRITIQDKRIRYDFSVKRNITVIKGDSATGKTQLIEMLAAYSADGENSGIELACDKKCVVLTKERWVENLRMIKDSIVFIDEGSLFVTSHDFARELDGSDNYYVLITRDSLFNLPYSVNEIYGIRKSQKYSGLKRTYNELYRIYEDTVDSSIDEELSVVTEDSNSGYEFWNGICNKHNIKCISADGKSNIANIIDRNKQEDYLVIADGAAFGCEMERITKLVKSGSRVILYLPESFEWLILSSDLHGDPEIKGEIAKPEDYIDSEKYISWERYFTHRLTEISRGTYLKYNKSKLNDNYLKDREIQVLLEIVPDRVRSLIL